ncbi:MAG: ubiquinol-cytochrome c reductase iron-sulfur subunit [Acidimicrobiia bacterium]|nr:ubiquinol-cytochrome c reductase iron-sulfur subunit [Acidimicrobiia bacterium]
MTTAQLIAVFGGALAVFAALAAFVIAYRKGPGEQPWEAQLDKDALRADRSSSAAPIVELSEATTSEATMEAAGDGDAQGGVAVAVVEAPVAEVKQVVEISPADAGVNRRQFFNRALAGTFFAWLGMIGLGSFAMMWPRVAGGFGSDVDAGAIQEIRDQIFQPDGTITPFFYPEAKAWIVPVTDDELNGSQFEEFAVAAGGLMALWQKCVHLGCRVPWCQTSQGFECPCHGSKYNAAGEYEGGPAPRNLDRFIVEDLDGRLIIKTGQVIPTERAQVKSVKYPQGVSCLG